MKRMKFLTVSLISLLIVGLVQARPHTKKELKPLLENRCYLSKSRTDRAKWFKEINDLPEAEFAKTMKDLDAVNAGDRLLGTKGCDIAKKSQ